MLNSKLEKDLEISRNNKDKINNTDNRGNELCNEAEKRSLVDSLHKIMHAMEKIKKGL